MTYASIGSSGRTTIRKDIRDLLRLEPRDRVAFVVQSDGTAVMVPVNLTLADLKECLPPPKRILSLGDLDTAVGSAVVERTFR